MSIVNLKILMTITQSRNRFILLVQVKWVLLEVEGLGKSK